MGSDRHLHPLSWVFSTARVARGFVVPWVLLLFASGGSNYELWASVLVVPAALAAAVQYLVFRYRLDDDELVIRDGVLTRRERHIPYARIENIGLVANPVHRLLRVALVQVETSSGGKPEAVIRVLGRDAVEEMRAKIFGARAAVSGPTPEGVEPVAPADADADVSADSEERAEAPTGPAVAEPLLHVPVAELARLGIVSNKGMVVLGGIVGLLWQGDVWEMSGWSRFEAQVRLGRSWLESFVASPAAASVAAGILLFVVGVALLRLLSIAWFILQLHGFTLRRAGDEIHAEYGLLNRVTTTLPVTRIQALRTIESPLHRRFGRQSVELQMVGGRGEDYDADTDAFTSTTQWLAPMIDADEVPELVARVLPGVEIDALAWQPLAPRAWRRIFKRWALAVLLVTLPGALFVHPGVLLLLGSGLAFALVHARLYVKHTGYALSDWGVVARTGWWNRTTTIVRYGKIQTVAQSQSPFDRRRAMASIQLDAAGGEMFGHTVDIPYLDAAVAAALGARLYAEAGRRAYRL